MILTAQMTWHALLNVQGKRFGIGIGVYSVVKEPPALQSIAWHAIFRVRGRIHELIPNRGQFCGPGKAGR